LALVNHVVHGVAGPVSREALLRALAFAGHLESHARRVYGASGTVELVAAKAILARVRSSALADGFTARDVHRHGWSGLTDHAQVQLGLDLLVDLDHLAAETVPGTERRGRPKVTYSINPRSKA
jgi:hypothetical protein